MGWIYSAFYLSYTLCMLPCGHWIDRVGPKRALLYFALFFRMECDLDGNRWNGHGSLHRPPGHADHLTCSGWGRRDPPSPSRCVDPGSHTRPVQKNSGQRMGFGQCLDRCRLFLPTLWRAHGSHRVVGCAGGFWCGAHGDRSDLEILGPCGAREDCQSSTGKQAFQNTPASWSCSRSQNSCFWV